MNLEHRQQAFALKLLPTAFRHAVEITRQLGRRYLWIDSLCIVQSLDDSETDDWQEESKRMEMVYANAFCTLAMHSKYSPDHGPLDNRPVKAHIEFDTSKGPLLLSNYIDNFETEVNRSDLSERGWVMQERILSRRTIHVGLEQTYFECGSGIRCQDFALIKPVCVSQLSYRCDRQIG
jgi:hypothetical protein